MGIRTRLGPNRSTALPQTMEKNPTRSRYNEKAPDVADRSHENSDCNGTK